MKIQHLHIFGSEVEEEEYLRETKGGSLGRPHPRSHLRLADN
jgi:hypothetical protein